MLTDRYEISSDLYHKTVVVELYDKCDFEIISDNGTSVYIDAKTALLISSYITLKLAELR